MYLERIYLYLPTHIYGKKIKGLVTKVNSNTNDMQ